MRLRQVWGVLWGSGAGRVGVLFLATLVLVSLYVVLTYPADFGLSRWNNPAYWADNTKSAPPAWTGLWGGGRTRHRVWEAARPQAVVPLQNGEARAYSFPFSLDEGEVPSLFSLTLQDALYHQGPPLLSVELGRPDGRELTLLRYSLPGPRPGEAPPIARFQETPLRLLLSREESVLWAVSGFLQREFATSLSPAALSGGMEAALFGTPLGAGFRPLPGQYTLTVEVLAQDPRDRVGRVKVVLGGSTYGAMGTDALGRDLASGLLFGFPISLLIGLATALAVTTVGTFLGVVSGFSAGRTDTLIQRTCDVLVNIPLLPILIFLIFLMGQRLWLVVVILIAFGWPGLTIVVRSMVLQLRSGQLVEALYSMGASRWRIMFRHHLVQIAPFILAQLIFITPAAILAEAGLSFLGLGDPSIPTWGQLLEQGFRTGAVYLGYWWWVLPPGLLIVATAMTFMLLVLGLEPVVNPRLRSRF
ncbi:MAG: ABC transporter permease [Chloroflexota bacterium]